MTAAVEHWAHLVAEEWGLYQNPPPQAHSYTLAVIERESSGNPDAPHHGDAAVGLMGVIGKDSPLFNGQPPPAWARERPTQEALKDPKTNIRAGIRILSDNYRSCNSWPGAFLMYYTGECNGWLKTDASGVTGGQYVKMIGDAAIAYRQFDLPPSTGGAEKLADGAAVTPEGLIGVVYRQVEALTKVAQEQQRTIQRTVDRVNAAEEAIQTIRRGLGIGGGKQP